MTHRIRQSYGYTTIFKCLIKYALKHNIQLFHYLLLSTSRLPDDENYITY